jgi:hypothetical protein
MTRRKPLMRIAMESGLPPVPLVSVATFPAVAPSSRGSR